MYKGQEMSVSKKHSGTKEDQGKIKDKLLYLGKSSIKWTPNIHTLIKQTVFYEK